MSIPIRLDQLVVNCVEGIVRSRVPMGNTIWDFGGGEVVAEAVRAAGCPSEELTPAQILRRCGMLPPLPRRRLIAVDRDL